MTLCCQRLSQSPSFVQDVERSRAANVSHPFSAGGGGEIQKKKSN
jgi:hypothetical protein